MWFGILGHLAVRRADGSDVPIPGPARRQLIAALLCRPGAIVTAATLTEDLWGSAPPRSAMNSLRSHVVRLRAALAQGGDENLLLTVGDGYRLDVAPEDVDAGRFEALVGEAGRTSDSTVALARYDEALGLWRGEPYVEFGDAPFAVLERIRLAELRALARERRTDLALAAGTAGELVGELEQRVRAEPYRERGWEQLALTFYRAGRQADALAACRRARQVLLDDLGVDPGPGLQILEQRLLQQDPELLAFAPHQITAQVVLDRCPYLGLAGYDEHDAALFVGRERLTSTLAGRLADQSVVVVTGASGVGKSSLVRAGLVPALRSGALPGSSAWRIDVRTPGSAMLAEQRRRPDLLVLDQAEELFTDMDPAERDDLVRQLARYVEEDQGRIIVVLRSDFYGRLTDLDSLAPFAEKAAVLVGPMRADELRRALIEPASRTGLRLEDELVETIMDDVAGQPEPLPLLSEAMVGTWQRRDGDLLTLDGYERAGELAGALEAAAEECYARLDEAQQRAARHLLVRMAARTDSGWVRRPVTGSEQVDDAEQQALTTLIAARLVVADERRVEITHEALLGHWPRLRNWLEERSLAAGLLEHLDQAAKTWHAAGRPDSDLYRGPRLATANDWRVEHPEDLSSAEEQFLDASSRAADAELHAARAQTRRLRSVAIALAVVVVLAVAGGLVALYERGTARAQTRRAQHAALVADARRLAALSSDATDTATASQLALAGYGLQDTPDTRSALLAAVERTQSALWRIQFPVRVFGVQATPDGSRVLVATNRRVMLVDPVTHRQAAGFSLPSPDQAVVGITADGRQVAVSGTGDTAPPEAGRLSVVGVPSGKRVRILSSIISTDLGAAAMTSDRRWVATITTKRVGSGVLIQVFDSHDWAAPPRTFVTTGPPAALAAGRTVVSVEHADGSVEVRAVPSLRLVGSVARTMVKPSAASIAVSPDGSRVARVDATDATKVTLYDTGTTRGPATQLPAIPAGGAAGGGAGSMAFSPDGAELAVGSVGGPVGVYRSSDGTQVDSFAGNGGQLFQLAWAAEATPAALYSVGLDGQLISWDVRSGPRLVRESGPDYGDLHLRHTVGSSYVIGSAQEGLFRADLRSGKATTWPDVLHGGTLVPPTTASSDGRLGLETILDRSGDNRTGIWNLRTHRVIGHLTLPAGTGHETDGLVSLISPDGRRAYAALTKTRIGVFALPSGRYLSGISVHFASDPGSIIASPWAIDPSGRLVVFGFDPNGPSNRLGVLDLASRKLTAQVVLGDIENPIDLAWSHDRRLLAMGMWTGSVVLLDAGTLAVRGRIGSVEMGPVRSVSFSPDDQTLATASDSGPIDFWTVPGLSREASLTIGDGRVFAWYNPVGRLTGFAPDPARPGTDLMRAFVLASDPASLAASACALAGGHITPAQWRRYVGNQPYRHVCP